MPATLTDINRRLGELLPIAKDILKASKDSRSRGHGGGGARVGGSSGPTDVSALALEATQLLTAKESTQLLTAKEATLILQATAANQTTQIAQQTDGGLSSAMWLDLIENETRQTRVNVDATGGLSIADWLEDIEADVDGLEGRLDTLIAANAADFASNLAELVLILAQLVVNGAIQVTNGVLIAAGNSTLTDIEIDTSQIDTNTNPTGGNSIAEWLEEIEANTDGLEGKADTTNEFLADLTKNEGNVNGITLPVGNTDMVARPDAGVTAFFQWIEIDNMGGAFPVTFRVFGTDGATEAQRVDLLKTIGVGATDTIILNMEMRRNSYLTIRATIAGAHVFRLVRFSSGTVSFTSPT